MGECGSKRRNVKVVLTVLLNCCVHKGNYSSLSHIHSKYSTLTSHLPPRNYHQLMHIESQTMIIWISISCKRACSLWRIQTQVNHVHESVQTINHNQSLPHTNVCTVCVLYTRASLYDWCLICHIFNRVYRLEIQSVILVFSTGFANYCHLTFSLVSSPPPPSPPSMCE